MQVLNLFPTDIYIEENTAIGNKKISEIILDKEITEPSRDMTNQGGWQSNDDLHKDERFLEILESISKYFQPLFKKYSYVDDAELYITNMWANVNRYKDFNTTHIHENVDWSFVYYVKVPENSGSLIFIDPRVRRVKSRSDKFIKGFDNPFTHSTYFSSPLVGRFVIFPSYLEHYVEPNLTQESRISISGNIKVEKSSE